MLGQAALDGHAGDGDREPVGAGRGLEARLAGEDDRAPEAWAATGSKVRGVIWLAVWAKTATAPGTARTRSAVAAIRDGRTARRGGAPRRNCAGTGSKRVAGSHETALPR